MSKEAVKSTIDLTAPCAFKVVALNVVPHCPQSYFEGGIELSMC